MFSVGWQTVRWRSRVYGIALLALLAGALLTGADGTAPAQRALIVAIDYQPAAIDEQLAQLKALGITQVAVRLTGLPSREQWSSLLDTLEKSGLEWRLWLTGLPRTRGWICLPERYRLRGTESGTYAVQIPRADRALLALAPRDQPSLQTLLSLALTDGRAVAAIGNSAESVLLLYPRIENALPDLWEGWDRYRDALLALLLSRKPAGNFRGWLIESAWDPQAARAFPESERFRAEWQGFLKLRYGDLIELERAWDTSAALNRFEQAAALIPLWHGERGLPYLTTPDGKQKPIETDPRECRFWSDYHAFLGERWRTMLGGLRQALLTFTPDAAFDVVQPMPDPTDLPMPDALNLPASTTGYLLPASLRSEWRTYLVLISYTAHQATPRTPLRVLAMEWQGESAERAELMQSLAREMGIPTLIWLLREPATLTREIWSALQATDSDPTEPTFVPFPISLWATTRLQKWRIGWWLPADPSGDLQPLFWGYDLFAFWRPVEMQVQDKQGNRLVVNRLELYLWTGSGEREVALRRFDQATLEAVNLNGELVPLSVRGDTVRLKVGTVPVRLRGFELLPLCESVVNEWTQRVESLLKRTAPAGQDARVLQFLFNAALETYRRDRVQGFPLVRDAWLDIERAFQPYRLLEAESAREHTFGTVRRDLSASSGATLWLHTPLKPTPDGYYARYTLNIRTDGAYNLYLACRLQPLRNGTPDSVEWQLFASTDEKTPIARGSAVLDPDKAVNAYAERFLWLPLGSAMLKAGDYQLELRLLPAAERVNFFAEWDALLIAPPGIAPRGILPPAH